MTESELELDRMAQTIGAMRNGIEPENSTSDVIDESTVQQQNGYMVCVLASGSGGNATFIQYGHTRILIDAGISCRRISQGLETVCGCTLQDLDALFVTHEHRDHIYGIPTILKKSAIPIYTTLETWQAMGSKIAAYQDRFVRLTRKVGLGELQIIPFSISHDAARPVGYSLLAGENKVTVATDLGYISQEVEEAAAYSDILVLEANHDEALLRKGPYPMSLQERILSQWGHLSNTTAAELLARLPRKRMMKVLLAHRSAKNNSPAVTVATMRKILTNAGITIGQDMLLRLACQRGNVRFQDREE